ncbi:MAG: DUF234 domain-containing protein [Streptosporangiaceae bacterium]
MLSRRAAAITRTGIRAPASVPYRDWDDALEHIASQAEDEPLLLVLDEDERRSKNRIYRIADDFLAFYLGPLSRYQPEIERGLGNTIADALLDRLDDYMGQAYENAFRNHLRRLASEGALGPRIVAIGPWWTRDANDEIDAVVLAEHDKMRVPVLAGESTWAKRIDGGRIKAALIRKATSLTAASEGLRYCACARDEIINADETTLTVTAADIFG